ncbi:MAG: crossover junction endodeoxyribonuclease RuvC [Deltaproteobacteria bacterium]|nr:crossover junction endodeoxyribonuclease RuvC [Deltaproteobacteria bacterium]
MPENNLHILGINPGTKYTGFAIFYGPELRDWGVKGFKGKWSKEKLKKIKESITGLINQYSINTLAIKKLHPARSSANLKKLVAEIENHAREKGLKIFSYSLKELETYFSKEKKINKKTLAELMVKDYPILYHDFEKEQKSKNPYFSRLFEAVALASACYSQKRK